MNTSRISVGMIVCRPDGHGIGWVERVEQDAIWVAGHRLPAETIARLAGGRVYLDVSAGRFIANW